MLAQLLPELTSKQLGQWLHFTLPVSFIGHLPYVLIVSCDYTLCSIY